MICFELNDPKIGKHLKRTLKMLKLGMVSSFHPHSTAKKLRGLRQKLDALRAQTGPSALKYECFETKTHLLQRHFILLNLFQVQTFYAFNMHHSKPNPKISTL